MSNETLARNIMEVLSEHGVYPDAEDDAFELRLAIRREIDGHLAAQAEWPSDVLVSVYDAVSRSNITRDVKTAETKASVVRAALESYASRHVPTKG